MNKVEICSEPIRNNNYNKDSKMFKVQKCQRLMKEKTKPNKHHKKENENSPEILSADLDEIKEEFMSKCFKSWVGAWCISTYLQKCQRLMKENIKPN